MTGLSSTPRGEHELTLFDLTPAGLPTTDAMPCMWHPKEAPYATHQVVKAADLTNPTWWGWAHPLPLYIVGAGYCDDCIARDAGAWLTPGAVRHFIPIAGGAS